MIGVILLTIVSVVVGLICLCFITCFDKLSKIKTTVILIIVVCFLFFSGFKTEKTMLTGTIVGSNIYMDWAVRGKYKRTYYDVSILVEENGYRKLVIENKNIAKNISSNLGDEVKIKKETIYWYGKFWVNHYTIK